MEFLVLLFGIVGAIIVGNWLGSRGSRNRRNKRSPTVGSDALSASSRLSPQIGQPRSISTGRPQRPPDTESAKSQQSPRRTPASVKGPRPPRHESGRATTKRPPPLRSIAEPLEFKSELDRRPIYRVLSLYERILFLDVETTGKYAASDRIVSLTMIEVPAVEIIWWIHKGRQPVLRPETYRFDPGIPIPPEATEVHGITNIMAADYPTMTPSFLQNVIQKIGKHCVIVGHNVNFDIRFIQHELYRLTSSNESWPDEQRHICTMSRFCTLFPGHRKRRLSDCMVAVGLQGRVSDLHSSEEDTLMTARLFEKLAIKEMQQTVGRS